MLYEVMFSSLVLSFSDFRCISVCIFTIWTVLPLHKHHQVFQKRKLYLVWVVWTFWGQCGNLNKLQDHLQKWADNTVVSMFFHCEWHIPKDIRQWVDFLVEISTLINQECCVACLHPCLKTSPRITMQHFWSVSWHWYYIIVNQ